MQGMRNNRSAKIQWQNGCLFWRFDSLNSQTLLTKCTLYWRTASKGRDKADWHREVHRVLWSTKPSLGRHRSLNQAESSDFYVKMVKTGKKECVIFKSFWGAAPDPAGGLTAPPPQTPSWIRLTSLAETTLKGVLRTPLLFHMQKMLELDSKFYLN